VASELLEESVHRALVTVDGLKRGRCGVRDADPVRPIAEGPVNAVIKELSPALAALLQQQDRLHALAADDPQRQRLTDDILALAKQVPGESPVAAMVQIQRLVGCRPGEVVLMRARDIDTSGAVWFYIPERHKTEHHGYQRVLPLGPRAQVILKPFLEAAAADPALYLFSPRLAVLAHRRCKRQARRSKVQPSQVDRSRPNPCRPPGDRYTTASYRRAIEYACKRAGIEPWAPNRIRHSVGTWVRKEFGIDHARALLGHRSMVTTEVYAELDMAKAAEVALARG
jgi:integrase